MLPLMPLYAAGAALRAASLKLGLRPVRRLQWPVISVGNLSVGGTGKTPFTIALAKLLVREGVHVDVLSRGYGRSGSGVELVEGADTVRFGDEPVLIAQRAEVPVWVGTDRFVAGSAAENAATTSEKQVLRFAQDDTFKDGRGVHLLDDGFQHRQLARAVDVVLVTREDLDDVLLPAGNLRESLSALSRADFVVVREEEMGFVAPRLKHFLREGTLIWTLRRKLRFPEPLFVFSSGLRPVAFCAIARPEGFAAMLKEAGCGIVDTIFFRDHHAYEIADMERVVELARQLNATGFVTTEKDAVKLTAAMCEKLETLGPVVVAALDVEFVFPEHVARELEERVSGKQ